MLFCNNKNVEFLEAPLIGGIWFSTLQIFAAKDDGYHLMIHIPSISLWSPKWVNRLTKYLKNMEMDMMGKEYYFNRYECIDFNNTLKIYLLWVFTYVGHQEVNLKYMVEAMTRFLVLPSFALKKMQFLIRRLPPRTKLTCVSYLSLCIYYD